MELVSLAKELLQSAAEQAASCRLGQTALRYTDRALWVVEKCARWAVPPPLDQDDRPQPELVRPLPWVFFLAMLVALRVTRESISLLNLILGKPPLRSADVVMYIQSKRRYLRTLKYQGNRMIRARQAPGAEPWYSRIQALFAFTMCFRQSQHYGNNNTTTHSNNEQVLVVRRGKRAREVTGPVASGHEVTMEQLIEKMMVDLDADSDDDSSFTLTNATSVRSDEDSESDQETVPNPPNNTSNTSNTTSDENNSSPNKTETSKTPEIETNNIETEEQTHGVMKTEEIENGATESDQAYTEPPPKNNSIDTSKTEPECPKPSPKKSQENLSPKEQTKNFIQSEKCDKQTSPKQNKCGRRLAKAFTKTFLESLANGRAMSVPNKKKGMMNQRRDTDIPRSRTTSADEAF